MLLAPEDTAAAWTDGDDLLDYTPSGLWFHDDDPDDGDGETDATPLETVTPWPGDYDDDRRRFEGEHLLYLDAAEWDVIDRFVRCGETVRGIGSRCAWTAMVLPECDYLGVYRRPSPVMGGVFLIFPD